MAARPRRFAIDDDRDEMSGGSGTMQRELLYGLGALALIAFAAFVWNIYGGREVPRIAPSSAAYKMAPPETAPANASETRALDAVIEGGGLAESDEVQARPGPEAPIAAATAPGARPQLAALPAFSANGPYVAQIAALRSQAGVEPAWARLSSRAPELFAQARLDVERADLGQRGVYYRVRAGYFADMDNVTRFCDRIRAMGQDCIAVRR